ncbi:3'-5' exonuclease [Algihabitans albus]|uniref:3'-5' exonuclease n=1 Tax=Algihabitans albus TaxID=2164067 RepID=UPI000E5C5FA6|nr:exonuclease domain-containing protein [Algihabitans albus]
MFEKRSLRVRIFLFFALIALAGSAIIVAALIVGWQRLGTVEAVSAFVVAGAIACFALIGLTAWVWLLFDENVAKPVQTLAAALRVRAHTDVEHAIDAEPARYLGDLGPACDAVTANLVDTRTELAEAVARETARIADEKTRLEAVLRDVPVGVLLCTPDHRIALCNSQAVTLLREVGEVGLDRPLFNLLREGPILHARARLLRAGVNAPAASVLCSTQNGARVLQGAMRLLGSGKAEAAGYVLTLRDTTEDIAAHAARERLLHEVFERTRRPAANISATLDALATAPELAAPARAELEDALTGEAQALARAVTELGTTADATAGAWWPMTDVAAGDLVDSLEARLASDGISLTARVAPLLLRCDGFALVLVLEAAVRAVVEITGAALDLTIDKDGNGAVIDLIWHGQPLPVVRLDGLLSGPLAGGYGEQTGRDALDSHGTDIWPGHSADGRQRLRLPLQSARAETASHPAALRPALWDFDLLVRPPGPLENRLLSSLTYVVFDTETTGLEPENGDEIVQIAALRIVNGQLQEGEAFESLVHPGRPIPPTSTEIHGIDDAMVATAPGISEAGHRFHGFCEGAVLVAHNAPFDMSFLRRHEAGIGLRFENPVLDTVLLSATLFGQSDVHTLDALTERLGVEIPAAARHTALGDARATAAAFLKMLPMLEETGITTLSNAFEESRKHKRLLTTVE